MEEWIDQAWRLFRTGQILCVLHRAGASLSAETTESAAVRMSVDFGWQCFGIDSSTVADTSLCHWMLTVGKAVHVSGEFCISCFAVSLKSLKRKFQLEIIIITTWLPPCLTYGTCSGKETCVVGSREQMETHSRMTSFLYEWSILGVGRRGGVVRPARGRACNYR